MTLEHNPALFSIRCKACNHIWTAFCPYGYTIGKPFECPACRTMSGWPIKGDEPGQPKTLH